MEKGRVRIIGTIMSSKPYTHNWHVRVHKLKAPYRFEIIEYGYWNCVKPSKRILKRCSCKLVNMPRTKRDNIKIGHVELWRE